MTALKESRAPSWTANGFRLRKGTSVSHLFIDDSPPTPNRGDYFTARDARYMRAMGLDHVRVSIAEHLFWSANGVPHHEMFSLLDDKVAMAIDEGLRVIVCLHVLRSHPRPREPRRLGLVYSHPGRSEFPVRNPGELMPLFREDSAVKSFVQYWRDIAGVLQHHSDEWLAYELYNEPYAPSHEDWDRVWRSAWSAVRDVDTDRTLIVGSNLFQIPGTIRRLRFPDDDANILPSFHLYYPALFTHYRAYWHVYGPYSGPIRYPGRPVSRESLDELQGDLREIIEDNNNPVTRQLLRRIVGDAARAGRELGRGVYCGEFGCIDNVNAKLRSRWHRDVVDILEEYGIPWTQWDWKGNFGILDKGSWRPGGIEKSLRLRSPVWVRPPSPGPPLLQRIRGWLGRVARRLIRVGR